MLAIVSLVSLMGITRFGLLALAPQEDHSSDNCGDAEEHRDFEETLHQSVNEEREQEDPDPGEDRVSEAEN